tara:strand:+ start:65 stop:223 length:159 start_codon:yes stop_codon:yes gene_type:complete
MSEKYGLIKGQARRIMSKAIDMIAQDFEEINIERPQMLIKLIVTLEVDLQNF